jgi:DNA-binding Lrp family transcriptional regulator
MKGAVMIDERARTTVNRSYSDWWEVDREILECLANHGSMSVADIAGQLHLSEGETTSLLAMLAREGRVRICQVTLAG